jgi:hypothetical protein
MFHKDTSLNQKLSSHIQTSFEYKSVFPDSHKFTKSSLLSLVEENDGGEFTFNDLFEIVKEELDYLEEDRIKRETEDILMIGEEIKFIEKVADKTDRYKIISKAKKTDTRVEEIKRKWIDFSIREDEELEKKELLRKLQEEFNERRSKRKTLSDYT